MLFDPETFGLAQRSEQLLRSEALGEFAALVSAEPFKSLVEFHTPVCSGIGEVDRELRRIRAHAVSVARSQGLRLGSAGTHPFGLFERQRVTQSVCSPSLCHGSSRSSVTWSRFRLADPLLHRARRPLQPSRRLRWLLDLTDRVMATTWRIPPASVLGCCEPPSTLRPSDRRALPWRRIAHHARAVDQLRPGPPARACRRCARRPGPADPRRRPDVVDPGATRRPRPPRWKREAATSDVVPMWRGYASTWWRLTASSSSVAG